MKITLMGEDTINKTKIEYSFEAGGMSPYEILNEHFKSFLLGIGYVFDPCSIFDIEGPDEHLGFREVEEPDET